VPHATAPWVLVWGGASSVGLFTIQLARLSGYRVIATASPKNAELVKSSGADVVVNYRDADVVEQIKAATDGGVAYGVDTVSLEDTQLASVRAFGPKGGELLVILGIDDGAAKLRADVQVKCESLFVPDTRVADPQRTGSHDALLRLRQTLQLPRASRPARCAQRPAADGSVDVEDH
jgi:NADPH:quinone reductase-like Zn-dependent oxidoreductase